MKFIAKLIERLPIEKGQGKNGEWRKETLVFETTEAMYPKTIAVDLWNNTIDTCSNIELQSNCDIHINIESRRYNERYFTNVSAWKIDVLGGQARQSNQNEPTPPPVDFNSDNDDDLPF